MGREYVNRPSSLLLASPTKAATSFVVDKEDSYIIHKQQINAHPLYVPADPPKYSTRRRIMWVGNEFWGKVLDT